MIRLYGVDKGHGSWARVSAGVQKGLASRERLAGFYDVGRVDAEYDSDGDALEAGFDAPIGLCVGAPPAAGVMMGRGSHKERLLMIATNSTWLPEVMMERASKLCTGFAAPSQWSASIIARYTDLPVYVYPHGVDDGFREDPKGPRVSGGFRALHLASTHLERKGTQELILGWAKAVIGGAIPTTARLLLIVDGPRGYFLDTIFEATGKNPDLADTYVLEQRRDLKIADMCALYRDHHIVVQPSRGEGFGMVPLEARAAGVPVVATVCTGHAEHMKADDLGVVVIDHGPDAIVNDGPGALAPTVTADAVTDALGRAYRDHHALVNAAHAAAVAVRKTWSWRAVTKRFLDTAGDDLGIK